MKQLMVSRTDEQKKPVWGSLGFLKADPTSHRLPHNSLKTSENDWYIVFALVELLDVVSLNIAGPQIQKSWLFRLI